jgi:hypothetical protein
MVARGGIHGYEDHSFRPNNTVSAAELAAMLVGAAGQDTTVTSGNWAQAMIRKARNMDITSISDADASKPITREQMADMLIRSAYAFYSINTNSIETGGVSATIGDFNNIAVQYRTSVTKCYSLGLLEGKGGNNFEPQGSTTRAEAATICARLLDNAKRAESSDEAKRTESSNEALENAAWSGLLWIGDTIEVDGKTYTIEKDPATGVIGRGIPTAIWEGYRIPTTGKTVNVGAIVDIIKDGYNSSGQVYEKDYDTGETHFQGEWRLIVEDLYNKAATSNGGTLPADIKLDIWGNPVEAGSNVKVYFSTYTDAIGTVKGVWHGPTTGSLPGTGFWR